VDGLTAKDWIDLSGCTGLTSVDGLTSDRIDLSGCTGLTSVDGLTAKDWIDLSGCTGLTSVDGLTAKEIYVVQGIPIPNVLKNIENIRTKY